MEGQMARTHLDLDAPFLKVQCYTVVTIVFLSALLFDGGVGSPKMDAAEGVASFHSSLETHQKDEATKDAVFTNGFGAQPRLFEPRDESTGSVFSLDTATPTISPTHSTFLETQTNHTFHLKVTNSSTIERVQTLPNDHSISSQKKTSQNILEMQTVATGHYFLRTSLSDYSISSSIMQTHWTEELSVTPTTLMTSLSIELALKKPVTSQSMDSSVNFSQDIVQTLDSSSYDANSHTYPVTLPIFVSSATFVSPTSVLVETPVQHHQMHSEGLYDDEVIVALPGVDSESNLISGVGQAHGYLSVGVNVMDVWNYTTSSDNSMMGVTAPALVMTSPPDLAPSRQEPSSESQVRKEESQIPAGTIAGIVVASIGFVAIVAAALGFAVFRRLHILRNKSYDTKFSSDTCSYLDSLQVSYINNHIDIPKESSDEMFSLDNDSFLNSLEAMTMENYWAEDSQNTKV